MGAPPGPPRFWAEVVQPIGNMIILLTLVGIGLHIDARAIRAVVRPANRGTADYRAFVATLCSTAVFMPCITVAILKATDCASISPPAALGILVSSLTPGGSLSNILAVPAHANATLNLALTMAQTIMAMVLLPVGAVVLLPTIAVGGTATNATASSSHLEHLPLMEMVQACLAVVLPLLLGVALSRRALSRYPKAVWRFRKCTIVLSLLYVLSIFLVAGLPPVKPVAWVCVLSISAVGVIWSAALGKVLRQPTANRISMVLETSIKDGPMYAAILMTGLGSLPFEFRYEAVAAASIFALTLNNVFIFAALGFQGLLAWGRRRGWTSGMWAAPEERPAEFAPEHLVDALHPAPQWAPSAPHQLALSDAPSWSNGPAGGAAEEPAQN